MQSPFTVVIICVLNAHSVISVPFMSVARQDSSSLPFPPHEDIATCHFTSTVESPTQPWHGASLYPTSGEGQSIRNGTSPILAPSSLQEPTTTSYPSTWKRDATTFDNTTIAAAASAPPCSTVAEFDFRGVRLSRPLLRAMEVSLHQGHYVLSFFSDRVVDLIWLRSRNEQTLQTINRPREHTRNIGTVYFTVTGSADVKFQFLFECRYPDCGWASGEVALFRIGRSGLGSLFVGASSRRTRFLDEDVYQKSRSWPFTRRKTTTCQGNIGFTG